MDEKANKTDHFYTTDSSKETLYNYTKKGIAFYILKEEKTGSVKLLRYYFKSLQNHFYCIDPSKENIEGGKEEPSLGWVFANDNSDKSLMPLHRYRNDNLEDHFYTTDPDNKLLEKNGYHYEKVECYVYNRPVKGSIAVELWAMNSSPEIFRNEEKLILVHDPETHEVHVSSRRWLIWSVIIAVVVPVLLWGYDHLEKRNQNIEPKAEVNKVSEMKNPSVEIKDSLKNIYLIQSYRPVELFNGELVITLTKDIKFSNEDILLKVVEKKTGNLFTTEGKKIRIGDVFSFCKHTFTLLELNNNVSSNDLRLKIE